MDSGPLKDPNGNFKIRMSFDWKDQGWGGRKGRVEVKLISRKGDVLATEVSPLAFHEWTKYDVTFDSGLDIVSKVVDGSFYRISVRTGGGGGHTLTIKNFDLTAIYSGGSVPESLSITPCEEAIGFVVYDVVCLAIGGVALRASANAATARALAEAVEPAIPRIVEICSTITREASYTTQATGVFKILSTIWSGGMGGAVLGAFLGSLKWYTAFLYSVTAMGTIVAAVATDGATFIAESAVELATFGFLVVDSVSAVGACSSRR